MTWRSAAAAAAAAQKGYCLSSVMSVSLDACGLSILSIVFLFLLSLDYGYKSL